MKSVDVIIVGAGSTGLFLASRLRMAGISYIVLEKRDTPSKQSRAIGIHPPGLQKINAIGLLDAFVREGIVITRGQAWLGKKYAGSLELCSGVGHDFILSIPQFKTESILGEQAGEDHILRGIEITSMEQDSEGVTVQFRRDDIVDANRIPDTTKGVTVQIESNDFLDANRIPDSTEGVTIQNASNQIPINSIKAKFLIGCDGSNSVVRRHIGADWIGTTYEYNYTMGDYPDNTSFSNDAVIFLDRVGLTESFPLPGNVRRWVINHTAGNLSPEQFTRLVLDRTGFHIDPDASIMHSNFKVSRFMSTKLYDSRIILCGDSAHVMSPIGGQAMSLHWVHCEMLCSIIQKNLNEIDVKNIKSQLQRYSTVVRHNAKKYSDRSDFNTKMGLPGKNRLMLGIIVQILLKTPLNHIMSKRFAMKDLNPLKL